MLRLQRKIKLDREACLAPNLTEHFTESDLAALGTQAWTGYIQDKASRKNWEKRMEAAMDLAMQLQKDKNFPWPNCSNVAFPLITIAALQFHSRAYPMIVQGSDVVRCKVWADDPRGEESQRANRVSKYMSYQLLEEDEDWEEQHDRMLIQLPIIGCAFKKTYFSGNTHHNESELVNAFDLVMDYWAKSVEGCMRKTHTVPMFRNEIYTNCVTGVFRDVRKMAWFQSFAQSPSIDGDHQQREDQREGLEPTPSDEATPFRFLEQHCWLDLDGDGYAEPYVLTLEASTQTVVRIVSRIENPEKDIDRSPTGEIIRIRAYEYFTKYSFIPSPDGSVYDLGFGIFLGPLNESVNSIINQLIDSGTMNNLGGGFLGRGAKIRGGVYNVAPFQWVRVDSTGDDLRKNIMPLPTKEPSPVLFQLLGLLINYTERISGATDVLMGMNPGQNTKTGTMQEMVDQGMKVYSNIFKRIWRGMKGEFKKWYELNGIYLREVTVFGDTGMRIYRQDFIGGSDKITPIADPNIVSSTMKFQQAQAVKQAAMMTPGYDIPAVELEYLKALHIEAPERLYPGPGKVPPLPNPKMQVEQMKAQVQQAGIELKKMEFLANIQEQHRLNTAKIIQLEAQAHQFLAQANGEQAGLQVAAFNAAIGALKAHNDHLRGVAQLIQQEQHHADSTTNGGGMGGLEGSSGDQTSPGMGQSPAGGPQE